MTFVNLIVSNGNGILEIQSEIAMVGMGLLLLYYSFSRYYRLLKRSKIKEK